MAAHRQWHDISDTMAAAATPGRRGTMSATSSSQGRHRQLPPGRGSNGGKASTLSPRGAASTVTVAAAASQKAAYRHDTGDPPDAVDGKKAASFEDLQQVLEDRPEVREGRRRTCQVHHTIMNTCAGTPHTLTQIPITTHTTHASAHTHIHTRAHTHTHAHTTNSITAAIQP